MGPRILSSRTRLAWRYRIFDCQYGQSEENSWRDLREEKQFTPTAEESA